MARFMALLTGSGLSEGQYSQGFRTKSLEAGYPREILGLIFLPVSPWASYLTSLCLVFGHL